MRCHQLNLQTHFGGGEVYTAFLCRALDALGVETTLYHHPQADFWDALHLPATTHRIAITSADDFLAKLNAASPYNKAWILGHGPLPTKLRDELDRHLLTAIAHMPIQGRNPRDFDGHDQVFAVSAWVRDGLLAADIPTWSEPLYGVANLKRSKGTGVIRRTSYYDWDQRKMRDRLLGVWEPLFELMRPHPQYVRKSGLTLGIVSRLTPIKQFPLLFETLAPVLARFPEVNLEIFGSGGYASVRDLKVVLQPCIKQVRFWGQQHDVASVYPQIDYLLTGLPEKEALGLNILEAQACGTAVLAVNAPPFTETVSDGVTGYLYEDPRKDQGEDFARLLEQLSRQVRLQPDVKALDRFSSDSFRERVHPVVNWVREQLA